MLGISYPQSAAQRQGSGKTQLPYGMAANRDATQSYFGIKTVAMQVNSQALCSGCQKFANGAKS